jgi:hypothetical protein
MVKLHAMAMMGDFFFLDSLEDKICTENTNLSTPLSFHTHANTQRMNRSYTFVRAHDPSELTTKEMEKEAK